MNSKIKSIHARQIVDCKCRPMVEVDVVTEDGCLGRGCAPTGSSVGMSESYVLRDNNPDEYHGLSVHKAVDNVNNLIAPALCGMDVTRQKEIDQIMIDLDGTPEKKKKESGRKRNLLRFHRCISCCCQGIPPDFISVYRR